MAAPKNPVQPAWSGTIVDPAIRRKAKAPDPETDGYRERTIERLEIFADRKLVSDDDIWNALCKYAYALAPRQVKALRGWLIKRMMI